ncbi:Crp/Fnr family transcriptional regulator [Oceanicola sp. 22II-s10i]|uniref:Crp/Fnr family transcriptional regulator n=1 Tax=Oceanicola sp. 22II-s10i TaxID=1317116 RepID=UPI000B527A51|nr:Crp/Fnr family transcriptional regulator [Oceanicola sp. 22II-s10i]
MPDQKIEAIQSCYLFSEADRQGLSALAQASRMVRSAKGTTIFQEGDEADGLRVMLSGLVRIWIADQEGRELTLALVEPGETFGEIAMLDGLPRTANATALEDSECLVTPSGALDAALAQDTKLARHLIQLLCELLRRNTETMGAFAFLGLDGRLAQKLHDLALSHATVSGGRAQFQRQFSQTDLAQMLGVTREAVNKRLKALTHDGLIQQTEGLIAIPDLGALAARAQSATGLAKGR